MRREGVGNDDTLLRGLEMEAAPVVLNWMTVMGSALMWAGFATVIYTCIKPHYDPRHSKPR